MFNDNNLATDTYKHPKLTETNQLKCAYNDMYSVFSDYIWNFDVVAALVDLEMEVYKLFPDLEQLHNKLDVFRRSIRDSVARSDEAEELTDAIDTFDDAVREVEDVYVKIESPKEVLV